MKQVDQDLDMILASLTEMEAEWQDDTARHIIASIAKLPQKELYTQDDLDEILRADFPTALTIFRLFLGIAKDELESKLPKGGVKRYRANPKGFLDDLEKLGVLTAMTELVNRRVLWSDLLVERLKMGRGRAVRGQARGRSLEDFVEEIVRRVFGEGNYDTRCTFTGNEGKTAKADFAIPSKKKPRIVIESKGYAATGSKQTDVLGDLRSIVNAKRPDTALIFVTDGLTWRRRANDLRNIVGMQNRGEVTRIYTRVMTEEMEADLRTLKHEHGIQERGLFDMQEEA